MKNLRVIDKEKIESIIKAGKAARIYAASRLPIEIVCEMAVTEKDKDVLDIILERVGKEKHTEEVIGACRILSKGYYLVREFVAGIAPIEVVCEMAVTEKDNEVLDTILERIVSEKYIEEIIGESIKLSKAVDWRIREFVADIAPISVICEMAISERNDKVLERIIKRLESEKDTEEVVGACENFFKAYSVGIIGFAYEIAPISVVCERAIEECNTKAIDSIIKRLKAKKDTEEVIGACQKLSKAVDWRVREFTVTIAPISLVCEMAIVESDKVLERIFKRLNAEKYTEEVIGACQKLSKAINWRIRKFVADIAPISVVCEMAVEEQVGNVEIIILKRLENPIYKENVINSCEKVSHAKSWGIREFVAGIAPIEVVCEMAVTETNKNVLEIIIKILMLKKNTVEVIDSCEKLSQAKSWRIRELVAGIAPISIVCEMAVNEMDTGVLKVIIKRLENAKDKDVLIGTYEKLSEAKSSSIKEFIANIVSSPKVYKKVIDDENNNTLEIILKNLKNTKNKNDIISIIFKLSESEDWSLRNFAATIVPISLVCEMAVSEKDKDVLDTIIKRLEAEKHTEEVKNAYKNLLETENLRVREFIVNNCPINLLLKIAVCEKNSDIVEIILKRLNPFKDTEEVRIIYNKLCKYSSKRKEYYKDMSDDELIEIVEAEGEGDILKLVDEMSN